MSFPTPLRLGLGVLVLLLTSAVSSPSSAQSTPEPPPPATGELDAFMDKVLARREVNIKTLQQYILDESERFEILGPGRTPVLRRRREYAWYVRDGMHVRSPVRVDGVAVGDGDRERYEADWIRRERARQERKAKGGDAGADERERGEVSIGSAGVHVSSGVPTEPRFVSEAYFLEFKFEPGRYYLAGREHLEGQEVLKIEYYPARLFGGDDDDRKGEARRRERSDREQQAERDIEARMNKTALVTLWVDPREHQIVRYVFENVWLDFLPGAWLVRVDEMRAAMTMGQPFPGVWLPREMRIGAGVTLASGSFDASYERTFSGYRLAEVETRIGPPRGARDPERRRPEPGSTGPDAPQAPDAGSASGSRDRRPEACAAETAGGSCGFAGPVADEDHATRQGGPFVPESVAQPAEEIVREVRVHGNAFLSNDEVLAIAGVRLGERLTAELLHAVEDRLRESRRFETVEVRKRYRSLADPTDIALVLLVHEHPGVRSTAGEAPQPLPGALPSPARRLLGGLMFLPIVGYADGYGFTYGGRVSVVGALRAGERISVPLTWGGTRRAGVQVERDFERGPLTRVSGGAGISSRTNPRFDLRDTRVEVEGRAERVFADLLRASVRASRGTVGFGALDDRLWSLGTALALDTRGDPAYPANALYASIGWARLHVSSSLPLARRVSIVSAEARGYVRVFRQVVLAARAHYAGADATLPPYERLLVGGAGSLRGFRAGSFDGDRAAHGSAELRLPVTSVLSGAKLGILAFLDGAATWDHGRRLEDAAWHRGAGAGVFLIASIVRINLEVARGLGTGRTRLHLSSGFSF